MIRKFDKLYAVSDLHLGGPQGRQAFRETDALSWLIRQAQNDNAGDVALLLNGDVVDFLADEADAKEFNLSPEGFLRRTAADPAFEPVFSALRDFMSSPQRFLVLQVGNHDIELALPGAQRVLHGLLNAPDTGAQDRILIESSGAGWRCRVGEQQIVLAVHGNASDPWNEVDYGTLGKVARSLEGGRPPDSLPATNAGTTMVIYVINEIKKDYPFVDLLKPEGSPLMAVLEAVNAKKCTSGLLKALGIRMTKGDLVELLSAEEDRPIVVAGGMGEMIDILSSIELPPSSSREALKRAEQRYRDGVTPRSLVSDEDEKLGRLYDFGRVKLQRLQASLHRLRGEPDEPCLRQALRDWLLKDKSFEIETMDPIDWRIVDSVSRDVNVLLAGHTHLPRELSGSMVYFNTGTWMRVLSLKGKDYLENDEEFAKFMQAVRSNSLDELDKLDIDPRTRPVAVVDVNGARLNSVKGKDGLFTLEPIRGVSS